MVCLRLNVHRRLFQQRRKTQEVNFKLWPKGQNRFILSLFTNQYRSDHVYGTHQRTVSEIIQLRWWFIIAIPFLKESGLWLICWTAPIHTHRYLPSPACTVIWLNSKFYPNDIITLLRQKGITKRKEKPNLANIIAINKEDTYSLIHQCWLDLRNGDLN